jgi:hypothetical protein
MSIESKFEELENIINYEVVRDMVSELKIEVMTILERSDNSGYGKCPECGFDNVVKMYECMQCDWTESIE